MSKRGRFGGKAEQRNQLWISVISTVIKQPTGNIFFTPQKNKQKIATNIEDGHAAAMKNNYEKHITHKSSNNTLVVQITW